jgi:hypothetical protein
VERGEISAFDHFVQFGQYQGRDPSILFDTSYYLERNPDVAAAVTGNETTAINHFINLGQFQGRDPSAILTQAIICDKPLMSGKQLSRIKPPRSRTL